MPLTAFFSEQLDLIEDFLDAPVPAVRIVLIDPEMRGILLRMLAGLDEQEDFRHLLIARDAAFHDPAGWFGGLLDSLNAQIEQHAEALAEAGVEPGPDEDGRSPPWRFLGRAERLAETLPAAVGSLVFLIHPDSVEDRESFARSVTFLADKVSSRRLKFIVLDERRAPCLAALASGHPKADTQTFWCSPPEMERRVNEVLEQSAASPSDRRRALMMAAGFAFSNRDYPRAEALQRQQLEAAESAGEPVEQAIGAYGLGNTLLAAGRPEEGAEAFLRACDLCVAHGLNELAPMAYTNLGVALHRLGNFEQAFEAMRVGSRFFRAQGNRPGEAFVCDNLAKMYQERGQPDEAARVWRYAQGLYDGITNPDLQDVREAGSADIREKLEQLGQAGHGA
ncbi:tetratricopeptide repeat protein [Inquilinus limosus]|uniref:tetratricopeptide repeat protein n=1 Tax=Inquilinus limosus TaxID=171674 RepID=UPI0003FD1E8B|nr:tetratricopeptide repeat protein [Inquilinus limosus]